MQKLQIRAGAQLTFAVERADDSAVSATFIAKLNNTVITDTVDYDVNGIAEFEFGSPETDTVGTYEYQVNENFTTGSPDKYPNTDNCQTCELPKLYILEALD